MVASADESTQAPYSFSAFPFPPGHFQVHAVRGREALSKPYAFDVTVTASTLLGDDLERIAVGHRALLVIRVGGPPRVVPGVVESVRAEGLRRGGERAQTTFRIVPVLALLKQQRGSRIFQDLSVDQVIDQVLGAAGIATRWTLTRKCPVRPYITQYEESDLAFVQRLLAEASIFYRFECPIAALEGLIEQAASALGGAVGDAAALVASAAASIVYPEEMVVFGDDPSSYPPIRSREVAGEIASAAEALGVSAQIALGPVALGLPLPTLSYAGSESMSGDRTTRVTELVSTRRVRSDIAEYREVDPARPLSPLVSRVGDIKLGAAGLAGAAVAAAAGGEVRVGLAVDGDLPAFASVGSVAEALLGLVAQRRLETYEHHGYFLFPDAREVDGVAERIRRRTTKKRVTAIGRSGCPALAAGHAFRLEDHPLIDQNRDYVVVSVEHRGQIAADAVVYENTFRCVPASITYAPKPGQRRTVQALLTATVVGPSGEDIYVDAAGRIKVLFHWDRRGAGSDTSCWIRCVQPWAGAAFGHQFIPRIGMEVAVAFESGDPDKPIVTGSLYNGTHPTPFLLPANKTQSGIRTQSTPGGRGYNELMFEDAAEREQIYVRAQRDLKEEVGNDHSLEVKRDEHVRVSSNRHDVVGKNADYEVHGDRSDTVHGDTSVRHIGSRVDVVEHALDQRVTGMRTIRLEARDDLEVRGAAEHRYVADFTTRVTGNQTTIVGKHDAPRSMTLRVEGVGTISTEDVLELSSNKGITLRCGTSTLRIGSDGIELNGQTVRLSGEEGSLEASKEGLKFSSEKVFAQFSDTVLIKTDKTSVAMGSEVKIDGQKILLNSPEKASDPPPPEPEPPTTIELTGSDGKPLAKQRFVIELEDGSQRTGVTDKDGKATLDLPSGGRIRFPELTEVEAG